MTVGLAEIDDDIHLFQKHNYKFLHILDYRLGYLMILDLPTEEVAYQINGLFKSEGKFELDNRRVFISTIYKNLVYLAEYEDIGRYFVFISNNYDLFFHEYYTGKLIAEHFY